MLLMFIEKFCFHLYRCPDEDFNEILKPKLAANIEKARIAMSRLEEIFTQNPSLQTTSVMRQLLDVYKDCRSVALEGEFVGNKNKLRRTAQMGEIRSAYKILVIKPDSERCL